MLVRRRVASSATVIKAGGKLAAPSERGFSSWPTLFGAGRLREADFQDLSGQDEEYFEVPSNEDPVSYLRSKLRSRATKFVTYYPPEFFITTWGTKSLNISSGRKALQTALTKLRETKGKYQYARSALVTGETG